MYIRRVMIVHALLKYQLNLAVHVTAAFRVSFSSQVSSGAKQQREAFKVEESNKEDVEAPTGPNADSRNPSLAPLDDSVYLPASGTYYADYVAPKYIARSPWTEKEGKEKEVERGSEYFPCSGPSLLPNAAGAT